VAAETALMRRRTRTNLFLFAMVALLGIAVYSEFRRENALVRDPLTTLDPKAIHTLTIRCASCTTRRFERIDGHWRMREPEDRAAEDRAVDRLAAIVSVPVRFRHPEGALEPAKVGLEPPFATMEADGLVLKFGGTDAIHDDRYVEVAGTIALVPDRFSALLFAKPETERAPQ